jgi:hypothetical protein
MQRYSTIFIYICFFYSSLSRATTKKSIIMRLAGGEEEREEVELYEQENDENRGVGEGEKESESFARSRGGGASHTRFNSASNFEVSSFPKLFTLSLLAAGR